MEGAATSVERARTHIAGLLRLLFTLRQFSHTLSKQKSQIPAIIFIKDKTPDFGVKVPVFYY
ncbi:MAG: hypothetical protein D6681_11790 [Calditrichaeota bacterium]|nr:MAG: hypothetical protein D6681_11790 [Calditrichota bacterium]